MVLSTRSHVFNILERNLGTPVDEMSDESRLDDDLGADSLDRVELTIDLEHAFEIDIPDDTSAAWQTVGDVVRFIEGVKS